MTLSRRAFLRNSVGGLAAVPALLDSAEAKGNLLPKRVLGRTKEKVSLLGFGTAALDSCLPDEAERILHLALELGVNYLDCAPGYGDPNSKYGNVEMKLKSTLQTQRDKVLLVTKVNEGRPDKDGVQRQLEESLKRLGVDHVDIAHIHNLGSFDPNTVLGPNGALAGLKEARKRGLIRFIGTSGHMRPARFVTAIETGEIDVTMNVFNFADRHTYDFEGLVLPAARRQGTAVVAMKILGGATAQPVDGQVPGTLAQYYESAIRYTLGLSGLACAVIGMRSEAEVRRAVALVSAHKPLSAAEKTALLAEGKKLAQARGLFYGPAEG
jgi:hypothetical protein